MSLSEQRASSMYPGFSNSEGQSHRLSLEVPIGIQGTAKTSSWPCDENQNTEYFCGVLWGKCSSSIFIDNNFDLEGR